jgi:MTH538 TIR-like domain (DUF1863)
MPVLRKYNIFISHAWDYSEDYRKIESWLNDAPNFTWNNLSVPKHDPISSKDQLKARLHDQMRPADVFIILGGMYVAHSEWILYEINFARRIGRRIIGIQPWGSTVMPLAVQQASDEIVGWNRNSIVNAVRTWALPANAS